MDESCIEVPSGTAPRSPKKEELLAEEKENDGAGSSPSGRSSPEANCPICLGRPENKSFTDSCLHQFCFTCLLEWSRVKAECPLCKQSFKSIIHNVRSIEDYEQYYLSTTSTEGRLLGILARYEPGQTREPFRYRTTAVSSYLDYFVRLEEAISHHVIPTISTHSSATHWQRRRQVGTSDFRRNVYQQGLWVQRMRDFTGRVRDCSPEFYRANPALVHRLVPWLNRELNVLCDSNEPHVQHVISRILEFITQVPIRSVGFSSRVAPYIGRHTEHFVHEFYSFATSPFDLIGYDRHANYVDRDSIAHEMTSSEDGNDSDVQIVGTFTSMSPPHPIQLDSGSESDECVVVDSVPPRQPSPEVITLESDQDDDIVQVNIHIGSDINRAGPSRRPPLKRNWLTVKNVQVPTSSNDNVNVSINIAHASRSRSSTPSNTSSTSSWDPYRKSVAKTKTKKKKSKEKKTVKGLKAESLKSKGKAVVKQAPRKRSSDVRSPSPVLMPRRRRPSIVLKSSSDDNDDDSNALHIVTGQYSTSSSDESECKPRLRSVVVKSNVKPEPRALSEHSFSPTSSHRIENNSENHDYDYPHNKYLSFDPVLPEHSNTSWVDSYRPGCSHHTRSYTSSSSEHPPSKSCKYSKKRQKREMF